jgi:hypothetical protein
VFFERFGDKTRIDVIVNEPEVTVEFIDEEDMSDEQWKKHMALPFITSLVLNGLRNEFETLKKLTTKAAKGKPIVIDGEEWLFAIAATKAVARQKFLEAYANEIEEEFD